MISEAKLVLGFSKTVWSGIEPKTPKDANKNNNATNAIPPKNNFQNHLMYFEKSCVVAFLFAINDFN